MSMDLVVNSKNVLSVANGLQEIQHYFVMIVPLVASVRSVVSVADGLLETQQWFAMTTREYVSNVDADFRQLRLTQHKRLVLYGTHPNPSLTLRTSFMLGTLGEISGRR